MESPRVYQSIQVLRALAALLVVLFHLYIVEHKYGHNKMLLPEVVRFLDAGVDLFFVISGFVMAVIAAGNFNSIARSAHFLRRRAWRILPLYWIYTTLAVCLMLVAPNIVNSSYGNQSIVASYFLWPQQQVPILTVGWTLIHEAYFYIIIAVAIALVREIYFPLFLALWMLLIFFAQFFSYTASPLVNIVMSPMTLEFIGGAFIGLYWRRLPSRLSLVFFMSGLIILILTLMFPVFFGVAGHDPLRRVLFFGSASLFIVLGAVSWEGDHRMKLPAWLGLIGESTYSIYLSHVFVISAVGRLWVLSDMNISESQHLLFIVVAILATLVMGVLSFRFMERPLLNIQRQFIRKSQPQKPKSPSG